MPSDSQNQSQSLGSDPIGRLLVRLSLPATVAMIVNGLYNLVDTIFIGRGVGTEAIGGLALAFPIQMLAMAFGMAIGQGAASVISRALGAQNREKASLGAGNAVTLALLVGIIILILGLSFMRPLLQLLGASEVLEVYARQYLTVILGGSPFLLMAMVANNVLRAEGKARISMNIIALGAILNILLDPLFIFVLDMGVAGAAWATILGQFASFLYALSFYRKGRAEVQIQLHHLQPQRAVIKEISLLGLPSLVRQSGQSFVTIMVNNLLGLYGGDVYISAYGVVNRLMMFLFMPLFGTVQGFQPIAGFNYGARLYHRVKKTVWLATLYATSYTTMGFLLLFLAPRFFLGIFTKDFLLIETGEHVLRLAILAFPLVGVQVIGGTYFQVVGKSVPSLILNISRQFLILIPALLILPPLWGLNGLLLCFPLSDALAFFITATWFFVEILRLGKTQKSVRG
ncbi:MAG: MATE family efflux transporter [Spirochaetales bacterium]|nr:MATE family efflux transporter [Spirochaetales bacterium]